MQEEACSAIMDTKDDVLLISDTASGKTEAAFFPVLSMIDKTQTKGISVLYISPLKALINDQNKRMNYILQQSRYRIIPWHGDISANIKAEVRNADGILQITPESLEAMLDRRSSEIASLFSGLQFIIIDEVHSFIEEDRGGQLLCLMERIQRLIHHRVRKIGLSATLGNPKAAAGWLSLDRQKTARIVEAKTGGRKVMLAIDYFTLPFDETLKEQARAEFYDYLYRQVAGKKALIFCNSRNQTEEVVQRLKKIAHRKNEPDIFYVHHGSVSASVRKEAEEAMRNPLFPAVTAATLTLELGIDLGDLDLIVEIGSPFSVSSFVQRLGRSGRKSGISKMLLLFLEDEKFPQPNPWAIPWNLLQGIAILELYLKEKWIEPLGEKPCPYSLLFHQTMAVLLEKTELSPQELARNVLTLPPFKDLITMDDYRILLNDMIEKELIEQTAEGKLICGYRAGKVIGSYRFYSVFPEEEEWTVHTRSETIGTITTRPEIGVPFILAGQPWEPVAINEEKKDVLVEPSDEANIPFWAGGSGNIHERIFLKMREILDEDEIYPYLSQQAAVQLKTARKISKKLKLTENPVFINPNHHLYIACWTSSKARKSLQNFLNNKMKYSLKIRKILPCGPFLDVETELEPKEFLETLIEKWPDLISVDDFIPRITRIPAVDKYDSMLPSELHEKAYLFNWIDLPYLPGWLPQISKK